MTLDEFDEGLADIVDIKEKPTSTTKVSRIDTSPEAEQKRRQVYNKWLQSVVLVYLFFYLFLINSLLL